jgi:hypothetical protein
MTLVEVFNSLLQRLGDGQKSGIIGFNEVLHWPEGALDYFFNEKLIEAANPAQSIECPGCPEACFKHVRTVPISGQLPLYVIPCDETDYTGNVQIASDYLRQWRISPTQVAAWFASRLSLRHPTSINSVEEGILLGLISFGKSAIELALVINSEISLRIGQQSLLLGHVVY